MTKFIESIGMGGGLLIVFLLLIFASGFAIIWFPDALGKFAYLVPIMFLFIAIGAFLLLLEHYAYTLHEMKPELPVAALGLPEGSVRAFLTIGLLTLVAVFGTFLYFESGKSATSSSARMYPLPRRSNSKSSARKSVIALSSYRATRTRAWSRPMWLQRRRTLLAATLRSSF